MAAFRMTKHNVAFGMLPVRFFSWGRALVALFLVLNALFLTVPAAAAGGDNELPGGLPGVQSSQSEDINPDDLMPSEMDSYQKAAALRELGRFDGISTASFNPGFTSPLTREQAIKVILQTLDIATEGSAKSRYGDVSSWAQPFVAKAFAMGITSGRSETAFGGQDRVTVRELLTFYLRAMGQDSALSYRDTYRLADTFGLLRSLSYRDQQSLSVPATREDLVLVACDAMEWMAGQSLMNTPDGGGAEDEDVVLWTLIALQNKDLDRLSALVHPVKGALFSADPRIDEPTCTHVMPQTLKKVFLTDDSLLWGISGVTGEPIELSFDAYAAHYLNRVNYRESHIRVSKGLVTARGNAPLNFGDLFPEAVPVEFFYPGTEAVEGKDFSSLILLFEKHEGRVYLVGVLNNFWMV